MSEKKLKVLIISGGGVYGLIPAYFLHQIDIVSYLPQIDVISGTSIGGILALYLASHKDPSNLYQRFIATTPEIFKRSVFRRFNPHASKYPAKGIERVLKDILPGKVQDVLTRFIVPAFGFKTEQPVIFHNLDNTYSHLDLWKIGRATSAAPMYFPPYSENILIDGGILENMPIITTATMIRKHLQKDPVDIDVFVLGTGNTDVDMSKTVKEVRRYTTLQWAKKLLPIIATGGNVMMSGFWGRNIGFHYFDMFNPVIIDSKFDDVSVVKSGKLEEKCDMYIGQFKKEWQQFFSL